MELTSHWSSDQCKAQAAAQSKAHIVGIAGSALSVSVGGRDYLACNGLRRTQMRPRGLPNQRHILSMKLSRCTNVCSGGRGYRVLIHKNPHLQVVVFTSRSEVF
jgi:hypothetical protein